MHHAHSSISKYFISICVYNTICKGNKRTSCSAYTKRDKDINLRHIQAKTQEHPQFLNRIS